MRCLYRFAVILHAGLLPSIAQEAIVLLAKGLDTSIAPKERRTRLLQKIEEEAEFNSGTTAKLDPVELIREDRRR